MTWSYNAANLATSQKDAVRAEIGDVTSGATVTLQDEEIVYFGTQERNFWGAAARSAEAMGRRYLTKADTRLGRSLMLNYTTQAQQYFDMARLLRKKAIGTNVPWVGGMYVADKEAYAENDLLVQPKFAKDMQENPWVGGYTSDVSGTQADSDGD